MRRVRRKILTILIGIGMLVNPMNIRASEQSVKDSVVLILMIDKETEEVSGGLTGVAVEKDGYSWVITASEVKAFSTDDFEFIMLTNSGESAVVYPFTDDGKVAFLYSETPVNIPALPLGTELNGTHEMYSITPSGYEDGQILYNVRELTGFTEYNGDYLLGEEYEPAMLWVGSPVFDMETAAVTGVGTVSSDGAVFKDITSDQYYEELALENWGRLGESQTEENSNESDETETPDETENPDETEDSGEADENKEAEVKEEEPKEEAPEEEAPEKELPEEEAPEEEIPEEEENRNDPPISIQLNENAKWLAALIAAGAVLVILMNQRKGSGNRKGKSSSESREDSYSVELSELQEKNERNKRHENRLQPTEPYAAFQRAYQLEGVSGALAGRSFRIEGAVQIGRDPQSCRIVYPADSKGISRNHCLVELREGRLLLRDLHSSYGTYFENGERLEPDVSYQVSPGTRFYLAETTNMFRITEEEWR